MMWKDKYIAAHLEIAEQINNEIWTGDMMACPLCQIARIRVQPTVKLCMFCTQFMPATLSSIRGACYLMKTYGYGPIRALYHEAAAKLLKTLPKERFHKRSMLKKHFPELIELDERINEIKDEVVTQIGKEMLEELLNDSPTTLRT